jgi:hypothetical protein
MSTSSALAACSLGAIKPELRNCRMTSVGADNLHRAFSLTPPFMEGCQAQRRSNPFKGFSSLPTFTHAFRSPRDTSSGVTSAGRDSSKLQTIKPTKI